VQIAGAAASGAYSEIARELSLRAGGKRRDFFVPDGNPFDLAAHAHRLGDAVERIAHQPINAAHIRGFERLNYSICNIGHLNLPFCVAENWRRENCRDPCCAAETIVPQDIVDTHPPSGEPSSESTMTGMMTASMIAVES
jgi:hypothetical protein